MERFLQGKLPTIEAPAKCKTTIYILTKVYYQQQSKRLGPNCNSYNVYTLYILTVVECGSPHNTVGI